MRLLPLFLLATALLITDAVAQSRMFVVFFGTGEDRVTTEAEKVVAEAAAAAKEKSSAKLEVAGYGDDDHGRDTDLAARRVSCSRGLRPSLNIAMLNRYREEGKFLVEVH